MKNTKLATKFAKSLLSNYSKNYAVEIILHRTGKRLDIPTVPSQMTNEQANSICLSIDRFLR